MRRWLSRQYQRFGNTYPYEWLMNPHMYDTHREGWASFWGTVGVIVIMAGGGFILYLLIHGW